jgi:hypothetical protein
LILLTDMRKATSKLRAGEDITVADRIRARRNQAYVTRQAGARHVSLNWDAVGTMYGQHAFGLEPRGQY